MKRMNILSTALGMMIVALSACTDLDETLYSQLAKSNYYVDQQSVEAAVLRATDHIFAQKYTIFVRYGNSCDSKRKLFS